MVAQAYSTVLRRLGNEDCEKFEAGLEHMQPPGH